MRHGISNRIFTPKHPFTREAKQRILFPHGGHGTKIKNTKTDILLNIAAVACLAAVTLYLLVRWSQIPMTIPGHYTADGQIDSWTARTTLWQLPVLGWVLYVLITILEQFPGVWNTGVTVTEENRTAVYRTLKTMIGWVKLAMSALLSLVALASLGNGYKIFLVLAGIGLLATFGLVIYFVRRLFQLK